MKRNSTRRRSPQLKTKVKVSHRLRNLSVAGAFALGVFSVAVLYNTLGTSKDSVANNRYNGIETLAEFKYRKQLVIDTSLVPNERLVDFPLMVSLQDNDLRSAANGGKIVSEKGLDIRFTKDDGVTLIDYEIEKYDPVEGSVTAWLRIDTLSKHHASPIYFYFSNRYSSDESSQSAWRKSYKGVWHLKGALSTKTPYANQLASAVGNTNDVYVAAERNSSRYPCLNTPEDVNITGEISVSAWVYLNGNKEQTIITNQHNTGGGYCLTISKAQKLEFSILNESSQMSSIKEEKGGTVLEKNKWYHVAAVYSDSGDSMVTYINGMVDRRMRTYVSMAPSSNPLQIGRDPHKKRYYFDGFVDEVRVANVVLQPEWIQTEFANQVNPGAFVKAGPTETIIQQISMSLLTLDAEPAGSAVELKWLTANEVDNELFTIERSVDGANYEVIGTKPGAGNSHEVLTYRFRDARPNPGVNYYRIKLTNANGNEEYSMITPANVEIDSDRTIRIVQAQPNPFTKNFNVDYLVPGSGKALIKLRNLKGEVLFQEEVEVNGQTNSFSFNDDKGIPAGVYFFSVTKEEEIKTVKLIKRT